MLLFHQLDQTRLIACGNESDFERAMRQIVDVLDPGNKLEMMSAAWIVFGKQSTLYENDEDKPLEGSIIDAWAYLSSQERIDHVSHWLETIQTKLST